MRSHKKFTLILGNMFAGKTTYLIQLLKNKEEFAKSKILVIKPIIDERSGKGTIKSSNGIYSFPAFDVKIESPEEIIGIIKREEEKAGVRFDAITIDEVQFFNKTLFDVIDFLLERYEIIAAGLRFNFRAEPFETSALLTALIDTQGDLQILHSFCAKCGDIAHYPQRIINGNPAPYDSEIVLVGGKETYEARCIKCHVVPGRRILSF